MGLRRLQALVDQLISSAPAAAKAATGEVPVDTSQFRENAHESDRVAGGRMELTPEQVATYREKGWVTPTQFRFPPETLERIKGEHARFVERYADSHPEFADYCGAILNYDLGFLNYARDPDILNMVAQCIGPDIGLWNSSFFAKPPQTGREVPWHQDGQYWAIRPLASCTVWIAVDGATRENGCLRMIPGSHAAQELVPHETIHDPQNLALAQKTIGVDDSVAEDLILEPGQISLHDVFLVHGSEPNLSDRPRRGLTLRYFPTTSLYDREIAGQDYGSNVPDGGHGHTLFLMRGVDHANNDWQVHNQMA